MKIVGSVAGDLPQCFQLRRPRNRLAVRMHGSADVRMCGRWAEDRPLTSYSFKSTGEDELNVGSEQKMKGE